MKGLKWFLSRIFYQWSDFEDGSNIMMLGRSGDSPGQRVLDKLQTPLLGGFKVDEERITAIKR